jgi:hypothetical protein
MIPVLRSEFDVPLSRAEEQILRSAMDALKTLDPAACVRARPRTEPERFDSTQALLDEYTDMLRSEGHVG